MKTRIFYALFFLLLGCEPNESRKLIDDHIMSAMVDKYAFPIPPPPVIGSTDTIIPKKVGDSLLAIKMKVAIYPVIENRINASGLNRTPEACRKLVDPNISTLQLKSIDGITSTKGHTIRLADTLELKKSKNFKNYDLLFHFSRIFYNKDMTRAIFELGVSRSQLAGSASIICMKREKNEWIIEHMVRTTEW